MISVLTMCSSACDYHDRLIRNLVTAFAQKVLVFHGLNKEFMRHWRIAPSQQSPNVHRACLLGLLSAETEKCV